MRSILREYLGRSSFHGLHYLVDAGLHWSERVFWLLCVLACWICSVYLMLTWLEFVHQNPVTLSLDNDYLHWSTPIPGLVVCETNSPRMLNEKNLVVRENLQQRIFFEYYLSNHLQHNYTEKMWLFKYHRSNCSALFNYCSWQNEEFDCCAYFLPVETSMGTCYSMNTIQSNNTQWDSLKYVHREHGNIILEFKNPAVKIFAISNDEIATEKDKPIVLQTSIGAYTEYKIFLSVQETVSELEIKEVEVERRKCRFPDENYLNVARNYSFNACKLQCQKEAQLKLLNCTHHYMPFTEEKDICTENQLFQLLVASRRWRQMSEKNCHCELGCISNNVLFLGRNVVTGRTVKLKNNSTLTHIHIDIMSTSTKTTRKRAHSMLDNIVNVGGTAGLFVGASLLSIIEMIYYITIRAFDTNLMEKRKQSRMKQQGIVSDTIYIEVYPFVN